MTLDYNVTDSRSIKSFTTLQERFSNIHKNRYDYTNFIYSKAKAKSTIICQLHGEFQLSADEHLAGTGCSKCGFEHVANLRRMGIDTFILNSSKIHGDKYDYSKGIYVNNTTPVTIICPDHGEFQQTPATHLKGGECPDCASQSRILRLRSDTKSFIKKANVTHNNYYNYSKVSYIDNSTNIVIICPIHGEFEQQPANHLQGKGCSNCAVSGFKTHLPGILYYVKVQKDNTILYKIGITNKTIKIRFKSDFQYITVLHQIHYKNGQDAYNEEQKYLKQFKEHKYIGPKLLSSGNTELFNIDILNINIGNI